MGVIIIVIYEACTCYASGTRWTLDHAVSPVALEHDLPTILDFPEKKVFYSYLIQDVYDRSPGRPDFYVTTLLACITTSFVPLAV